MSTRIHQMPLAGMGLSVDDLPQSQDSTPCHCHNCGSEHRRDELSLETGTNHHLCNVCSVISPSGEVFSGNDEDVTWRFAYPDYNGSEQEPFRLASTWQCRDCDDWYASSLTTFENAEGQCICESCSNNYTSCDACSGIVNVDDCYSNGNGETLCRSCHEEHEGERECDEPDDKYLHQYDYKPRNIPLRHDREYASYFLGVEVEVDTDARGNRIDAIRASAIPDAWYCKQDGSLNMGGDYSGFEIVSKPATWQWWINADLSFMPRVNQQGYQSFTTSTCGMHVHVSKDGLTKPQQLKLLQFFALESLFIRRVSRRQPGALDEWARVDISSPRYLAAKVRGPNNRTSRYAWEDMGRRQALNFKPARTIEYRIFQGTITPHEFLRNLCFVRTTVEFAKRAKWKELRLPAYIDFVQSKGRDIIGRNDLYAAFDNWIGGLAKCA